MGATRGSQISYSPYLWNLLSDVVEVQIPFYHDIKSEESAAGVPVRLDLPRSEEYSVRPKIGSNAVPDFYVICPRSRPNQIISFKKRAE